MLKYAKIINEETKLCEVGVGTDSDFYQSIGMTLQDVEEAWNGSWYLKGFAPERPIEEMQAGGRAVRNHYLEESDKFMISDYPITGEERDEYKNYRKYLRDYTRLENWWIKAPLAFEQWKQTVEGEKTNAE